MKRLGKILRFHLERWVQRGVLHQLLFVGALIVAISVVGGLVAWVLTSQFEHAFDGMWWSFLRLTDPGYLAIKFHRTAAVKDSRLYGATSPVTVGRVKWKMVQLSEKLRGH